MPPNVDILEVVLGRPAIATDINSLPGGAVVLLGWAVFNGGATATTWLLYNGGGAVGAPVGGGRVGANGFQTQWCGPQGIECPGGLSSVGLISGLIGSVWWVPHPGPFGPRRDGGGG